MYHAYRSALILTLLVAACGAPSTGVQPMDATPADGGPIRFNPREISAESRDCGEPGGKCARIKVNFPETTDGGTAAVRENIDLFIEHDLVSRMRGLVPEDVGNGIGNVEGLAGAFLAQFRAFVAEFPDATAEWFVEIAATPIYSTSEVATIDINETAYTGGAHPNSRRRLVSFDLATGQLLGVDDLTAEFAELTSLVEHHFRIAQGLESDADLAVAGFWFPEEGFSLPDNVGVVSDGLLFHWDAYEIAPYSMGPIDVTVPVAELAVLVDRSYW